MSRPDRICATDPDWISIMIGATAAERMISTIVEATSAAAPPARCRGPARPGRPARRHASVDLLLLPAAAARARLGYPAEAGPRAVRSRSPVTARAARC